MKKSIKENTKNDARRNKASAKQADEDFRFSLRTIQRITGHTQFDTILATYEDIEKKQEPCHE